MKLKQWHNPTTFIKLLGIFLPTIDADLKERDEGFQEDEKISIRMVSTWWFVMISWWCITGVTTAGADHRLDNLMLWHRSEAWTCLDGELLQLLHTDTHCVVVEHQSDSQITEKRWLAATEIFSTQNPLLKILADNCLSSSSFVLM